MSHPRSSTRYANQLSFSFLVWMVLFAVLIASGGVTYSVLKNEQVAVRTEIKKLRRDISLHRLNTNQYQAQANEMTNRWAMRERLVKDGSLLRDIQTGQIEDARSFAAGDTRRASAAR